MGVVGFLRMQYDMHLTSGKILPAQSTATDCTFKQKHH